MRGSLNERVPGDKRLACFVFTSSLNGSLSLNYVTRRRAAWRCTRRRRNTGANATRARRVMNERDVAKYSDVRSDGRPPARYSMGIAGNTMSRRWTTGGGSRHRVISGATGRHDKSSDTDGPRCLSNFPDPDPLRESSSTTRDEREALPIGEPDGYWRQVSGYRWRIISWKLDERINANTTDWFSLGVSRHISYMSLGGKGGWKEIFWELWFSLEKNYFVERNLCKWISL